MSYSQACRARRTLFKFRNHSNRDHKLRTAFQSNSRIEANTQLKHALVNKAIAFRISRRNLNAWHAAVWGGGDNSYRNAGQK